MGEAKRRKESDATWGVSKKFSYYQEFSSAVARTERFGLSVPRITTTNERFITEESLKAISTTASKALGVPIPQQLSGKCLSIHFDLLETTKNILKTDVIFTIGYVLEPPDALYYQSEEDLKNLLNTGLRKSQLNLHAWLTLPSMEILDCTLPTTIAVVKKLPAGLFGVISGHADELLDLRYHPMLVGDGYLRKLSVLIDV